MKTRGLPPPLTDSYFLSLSGCPDRGDKTQCLGQAAMLGEVVGRQLGEREWEAEGGEGGHRLASGSFPHHSPQHEGRWRMGNWATSGWRTVRAQAQVRPVPQQEARGLRRVVWGRTRLQERFTAGARAQASGHGLQGGSCPSAQAACEDHLLSNPTAAPGGPAPQTEGTRSCCRTRPRT